MELRSAIPGLGMQVGYPLKIAFERTMAPPNAGSGYKFEEFKSLVDIPSTGSVFD
jgi:hypothetical protein